MLVLFLLVLKRNRNWKCRCAGYVRARKELSIHEAPNILTIVLKRFQVSVISRRRKTDYALCFFFNFLQFSFAGRKIWENKQMYKFSWNVGHDTVHDKNRRCSSALHALRCYSSLGYSQRIFLRSLHFLCQRFERQLVQNRWFRGKKTPLLYVASQTGSELVQFSVETLQIHQVPMTQVMSEGAYMLFYMR